VLGPARARRDRLAHCWCAVPRLLIPCSAAPPPRSAVHGYRRVCPARCGRPAIWPGGPARRARRSVRP